MQRFSLKTLLIFIMLVLLQVLVFNKIYLGGYLNPQVYVFFILMLPVYMPGYLLLLVSFAMGLIIDAFGDSLAIHTFSSVLMAFCRPGIILLFSGKLEHDNIENPSFRSFGTFSLITYSSILIMIHHVSLFFMEVFRFNEFVQTLQRALLSGGLTLVFVLLAFAFFEGSSTGKRY